MMATTATATGGKASKTAASKPTTDRDRAVLGTDGKSVGKIKLPARLFDVDPNIPLIHQVVVAQQAAARAGPHSTKTRGEVSGGGAKPYRQKGTGRARQGSIRSPQFAGGGVVHGPLPRDYSQRTPKKMKAAALRCALSDRARHDLLFVLDQLVASDTPSTKAARSTLTAATAASSKATASKAASRVLLVLTRDDDVAVLSSRNLGEAHVIYTDQLNTHDVMVNDAVVFTKAALEQFIAAADKNGKSSEALTDAGVGRAKQEAAA